MLRVSAQTNQIDIDILGIDGDSESADQGIPFGSQLMQFGEAVALRDQTALEAARQALLQSAGSDILVDAAGVAANFQRMVRIADSIGIPFDDTSSDLSKEIRDTLGLSSFPSAQHSNLGAS